MCLPCSHLGDENGDGKGGFVVFDQEFNLKGTWGQELTNYGYDFWCVWEDFTSSSALPCAVFHLTKYVVDSALTALSLRAAGRYKPRHNLLISSEFGSPNAFKQV